MGIVHIIIFLVLLGVNQGEAATLDEVKTLTKTVLSGYNNKQRPIKNQSQPIVLGVDINLLGIVEFDEQLEQLSTASYIKLTWKDEFLSWNATNNGIEEIKFPQSEVWAPDFVNGNSLSQIKAVGDGKRMASIGSSGQTTIVPGDIFTTKCTMDITYYPYDIQRCNLMFATWNYIAEEVYPVALKSEVGLNSYEEHGTWIITNTTVNVEYVTVNIGTFASITATLTLTRRPQYYVSTSVLPAIVLVLLSLLIYILPPESGEKVSFAIAMFLATAIFLTFISMALPPTSLKLSNFVVYLVAVFILVSIALIWAILSVRLITNEDNSKIPAVIKKLMSKKRNNKVVPTNSSVVKIAPIDDISVKVPSKVDLWKENKTDEVHGNDQQTEPTWRDVSRMFDFIGFVFAILATTILTVSVFVSLHQAS